VAERSIAMLNLPDTVNLARLEKLFEPCGTVRKLQLRPDRGGAIVEFAHEQMVGRAQLALEGTELDGAKIEFGSPAELLKNGVPFVKKDKADKGPERKKGKKADKKEEIKPSAPARGAFAMKPRMVGSQTLRQSRKAEGGEANGKAKSNADFRALLKGNQEAAPEEAEETKEDTEMS
jgi:squamous cell carcinoma antigen recognized by T-cells 3